MWVYYFRLRLGLIGSLQLQSWLRARAVEHGTGRGPQDRKGGKEETVPISFRFCFVNLNALIITPSDWTLAGRAFELC